MGLYFNVPVQLVLQYFILLKDLKRILRTIRKCFLRVKCYQVSFASAMPNIKNLVMKQRLSSECRWWHGQGSQKTKTNKKNTSAHTQLNMASAPGKGVLSSKEYQLWHPTKGRCFYLYLKNGQSLLLVSVFFSLITNADMQCIFGKPQTGCLD